MHHDAVQVCIYALEQRKPTGVPHPQPHDGRATVEQQMHGEVFVLRDDDGVHVGRARPIPAVSILPRDPLSFHRCEAS